MTTPEETRDIMRPLLDDSPTTEAGALLAVYARLPLAGGEIQELRRLLWKAVEMAEASTSRSHGSCSGWL